MNDAKTFPTSDFPLATFLYAKGVILQDIIDSPNDKQRKVFVFIDPPSELLSLFQAGKAEISVFALLNAQDSLRGLLKEKR